MTGTTGRFVKARYRSGMRVAPLIVAVLLGGPMHAGAGVFTPQPPLGRYEARTIVTGTDSRSRPAGLAICLRDVLAKVSGDAALADDPRTLALDAASMLEHLSYVDRFSGIPHHDDQGSSDRPFYMTAEFDRAKIDAALRQFGERPYDGPRPMLIAVVFMNVAGDARMVVADDPDLAFQAAALREQSDRVGLPVQLPTRSEMADPESITGGPMISGTLEFDAAAHGWIGHWSMSADAGHPHDWSSTDASYDAAFRSGFAGALGVMSGHAPDSAK